MSRFDYVKYDDIATFQQAIAKRLVQDVEATISTIKEPRSRSLAFTKLEECYMWIGKGIRDDQITRNGVAELQESRGDE